MSLSDRIDSAVMAVARVFLPKGGPSVSKSLPLGACDSCGSPATCYDQTVWALLCSKDKCFEAAWAAVHD